MVMTSRAGCSSDIPVDIKRGGKPLPGIADGSQSFFFGDCTPLQGDCVGLVEAFSSGLIILSEDPFATVADGRVEVKGPLCPCNI